MRGHIHRDDSMLVRVVVLACALAFVVVLFFKFVDWLGPYSGGLSSPEVGKDVSRTR